MTLLEREAELAVLRTAAADAAARRGSVVLVSGEAGIGKSSLIDTWARQPGVDLRLLVGWCDDFLTSRTLGPLRDIARATGGTLADAVTSADTAAVFDALLAELDNPLRPTAIVIEDVHWADEATLDVLRYVGRRIQPLPAVVIITYREEEATPDHPLRGLLGALHGPVHRIRLRPLSSRAVATLTADLDIEPAEVVRITGGNPFFVTEIARGEPDQLPVSVAEAVQARVQALTAGSRHAVETLAVVPGGATREMAAAMGLSPLALAEAESRGILVVDDRVLRFRHELARRAIYGALPATTRIAHHGQVLEMLRDGEDHAAILHHAAEAGRGDVVAVHGPIAAGEAFRAGAYREAERHQRLVLDHGSLVEDAARAAILEQRAWTLYNLHRFEEARDAARQAVALREHHDDPSALARSLLILNRMQLMVNDPQAARAAVERAVALLEAHGDAEQQAEGLVARASTYALLEDQPDQALELTRRAVAVTEELPRPDLRSLALNYRAIATCGAGGTPDVEDFREAIRLALAAGHLEVAARAYTNLSFELMLSNEPNQSTIPQLDEALRFLEDHDFVSHAFDIRARKATVAFTLGHWDEAERTLRALRETTDQHGLIDLIALESLARLAVRRGDPDADTLLRSAWKLAVRSGAPPYLGLIGVIRIEQAWLEGRGSDDATDRLAALPLDRLRPRLRAEALRYARLAGVDVEVPDDLAEPWATALEGDWEGAASAWEADGRPYERAVELYASGQQEPMLEALRLFDGLRAEPAAQLTRRWLRQLGVNRVPRGPQTRTRAHPAGLTDRQAEVLDLIAEGLTNPQIAQRLVVSVRTVDHHVAAVLQKLGVSTRREAVERATGLGVGWL